MKTKFVTAEDGVRLAYDVSGSGPAILLLHGAGGAHTRQSWHKAGYVKRFQGEFTVVTMDIRGHGESDQPESAPAYAIETMCADILAVMDAVRIERFILWGFSYGGNIGRYLASKSRRVSKFVMISIPF